MSDVRWDNAPAQTRVLVQKGGPGNDWLFLDFDAAVDTVSGGGQSAESVWGRGELRGMAYRGSRITSLPNRYSSNLTIPKKKAKAIFNARLQDCPFSLRTDFRCSDLKDKTAYQWVEVLYDNVPGDRSDTALALAQERTGELQNVAYAVNAGLLREMLPLTHLDITTKVTDDVAINKVIHLGGPQCAGDCGGELDGEEEFWWVTDADATPGYQSVAAPKVGWTRDDFGTVTTSFIDVFLSGNALDIVSSGPYIIVVSDTNGVAYALKQDLIDGIANPWTLSSGITANFPSVLFAVGASDVWAAGAGGYVYRSTDSGLTFTSFDAAATTTEDINSISFQDETLGWFGCDTGVLMRYANGALSIIAVTDGTDTLTDNINVVSTPPLRGREVYVGTAGGEIWRSDNAKDTSVTFANKGFGQSGSGSIGDIQFAGWQGSVMFVLQDNSDGYTRVLRDDSGGFLVNNVHIIGSYTSPSNFGMNSIAPANINYAITVGEIHETNAFVGKVTAVA